MLWNASHAPAEYLLRRACINWGALMAFKRVVLLSKGVV